LANSPAGVLADGETIGVELGLSFHCRGGLLQRFTFGILGRLVGGLSVIFHKVNNIEYMPPIYKVVGM
jgi:hypothetical protein